MVQFDVAPNRFGTVIRCSGETVQLLTTPEVDFAVDYAISKLEKARAEAKAAIRRELENAFNDARAQLTE